MGVLGSSSANCNATATNALNPGTLPASIPAANAWAIAVVSCSSTARTLTASGWTISTPLDSTTNIRSWILTKNVNAGDSSTTPSWTFDGANTARWAAAYVVLTDVDALDLTITPAQDALGLVMTVPAWVTSGSYNYGIILAASQRVFSTTDGVNAWPASYTGLQDTATNFGGAGDQGAAIAWRDLGATTGSISATSGTWNGASRDNVYVIGVRINPSITGAADVGVSGLGGQTATLAAALATADTATGAGATSLATALTAADSGSGADSAAVTIPPVPVAAADTGHGVDTASTRSSNGPIQIRSNTPAAAAAHNPTLLPGQPGFDNDGIRVGTFPAGGAWNSLPQTVMEGAGTLLVKTTGYAIAVTDRVVIGNGSTITLTLPDPATVVVGRRYVVKNIHSSNLTVATAAATIDGGATLTLAQWAKTTVVSDGTQWLTI